MVAVFHCGDLLVAGGRRNIWMSFWKRSQSFMERANYSFFSYDAHWSRGLQISAKKKQFGNESQIIVDQYEYY